MSEVTAPLATRHRPGRMAARAGLRGAPSPLLAVAALVAVGGALRFATLGVQSFWYDEAVTARLLDQGFGASLATIPDTESTPPLYYVLAWGWTRVFGLGEVGLRSLSALLGTLAIAVGYLAARRLASRRAALVVTALMATNPFLIWYSQEARAYALLLLLGALSLLVTVRAVERPTARPVAWWALVSVAALSAHYFAALLVVPEAVWLVVAARRRRAADPGAPRRALAAIGVAALAGAALLPLVIAQNDGRASFIASEGSLPYRVVRMPKQFLIAFDAPLEGLLVALGALIAATALWLAVRRTTAEERRSAVGPAALAGAVIVIALVAAVSFTDYFNSRNLITAWLPLAIVLSVGMAGTRAGRTGALAALGLVGISVTSAIAVPLQPRYHRDNWAGVAQVLPPVAGGRAIVAPTSAPTSLGWYFGALRGLPYEGATVREVAIVALPVRRVEDREPVSPPRPPSPPSPIAGFRVVEIRNAANFTVVRYRAARPTPVSPPTLFAYRLSPNDPSFLLQP